MADERRDEATRGERREQKRRKKREALKMHGASLRSIYPAALRKRLQRRKQQPGR